MNINNKINKYKNLKVFLYTSKGVPTGTEPYHIMTITTSASTLTARPSSFAVEYLRLGCVLRCFLTSCTVAFFVILMQQSTNFLLMYLSDGISIPSLVYHENNLSTIKGLTANSWNSCSLVLNRSFWIFSFLVNSDCCWRSFSSMSSARIKMTTKPYCINLHSSTTSQCKTSARFL